MLREAMGFKKEKSGKIKLSKRKDGIVVKLSSFVVKQYQHKKDIESVKRTIKDRASVGIP